jgi:hypothetical protein
MHTPQYNLNFCFFSPVQSLVGQAADKMTATKVSRLTILALPTPDSGMKEASVLTFIKPSGGGFQAGAIWVF